MWVARLGCFLAKISTQASTIRTRRAIENLAVLRGYTETRHKAKSWDRERRTVGRIEATMLGLDIRFVVTSLDIGSAEWIYDSLYCARGQAENLIKLHKTQLASDRTSCRSALANQVRLVLHTGACAPFAQPIPQARCKVGVVRRCKAEGNPARLVTGSVRPHQSDQKTALS